MKIKCNILFIFLFFAIPSMGICQTINEKKTGFTEQTGEMTPEMHRFLLEVNRELRHSQDDLTRLYGQIRDLFEQGADEDAYHLLLNQINEIRSNINALESSWREMSVQAGQVESYGLWHQPETTLGQLVMDYGSQDYVYLMTAEIATLRLSVDSNLLIPRASWEDMIDLILNQNGIGYKQLNPYLRQLFFVKEDSSSIKMMTNKRKDLDLFSPESRVCFVLSPEPAEVRRTRLFLDKFVNPHSTVLQQIGRDIFIIGPIADLQDLLKLYDFVAANKGDREYKVFPIIRVDPEEMAKILAAIFDQTNEGGEPAKILTNTKDRDRGPMPPSRYRPSNAQDNYESGGLKIIALGNVARALFLVGTKEELRKAEQIIHQVENQVGEAREKTIFWYTAKNSDPEELAEILHRVYFLMSRNGVGFQHPQGHPPGMPPPPMPMPTVDQIANEILQKEIEMLPSELYQTSYYQQGNYLVNPSPVEPRSSKPPTTNKDRENFIVDLKTGSIAMVVEADILPKIKDLIKKLDVAKRMVQIECLLFERRVLRQNNFGLNLLKVGSCASQTATSCLSWGADPLNIPSGILDYFLSGKKTCGLPAYDIAYRFLMTQDDIQINASPSVVAINQTPATIAIVEESSINTGIYNVETAKGNTLEKAFTRAQYGITIDITPTIHITGDGFEQSDDPNYVTLDTDITFDTVQPGNSPNQPDVTRRHITNEVRVPDGQTVILGGLRRKNTDDYKESIPFFGELPCIGKLFSYRELSDSETEMFIFLTPTIISDPLFDFERIKCEEMRRRPGDIPEFLCSLVVARDMEKNRILAGSMRILFGPEPDRCYTPSYYRPSDCSPGSYASGWIINSLPCNGEYDGR
ncbi:MAG: type II secretion system protein GspD [Parachlamydiaceae bacterium]